jgi:aspartyl-tRNA(Asn)/glutamyl-tRNA(Gln) amidotransferase subunit A
MDHVGPFAADVSGLAIVMNAVAGHDRRDPGSALAPVSDYSRALTADLSGLTLGVPRQLFFDDLDDEVRRAVRRAIADLKRAGARVTPVSVPLLDDASRAASLVLFAEAAASLEKWHRTSPSSLGEDIRARLGMGAAIPAADYLKALRVRRRVQQAFRRVFERVDALVTPQLPITAPRIGDGVARINGREEPVPAALTRYTRIYNLTGLPSLSVCCGFSRDGLPIGLQIAARPFDEATTLRIGHAYQRHAPIDRRQPDLRNPD